MNKPMKVMLISFAILLMTVTAWKLFGKVMMYFYFSSQAKKLTTVSAGEVQYSDWQPNLKLVGSIRAVEGTTITTEVPGVIQSIDILPGQMVTKGQILIQLNGDVERAALHSYEAKVELDEINYERDKAQYAIKAVSKAQLDTDKALLKSDRAAAEQQQAILDKKIIRAPFSGKLGIVSISIGQYVSSGDKLTNLQSLDRVYVDFDVPQQFVPKVAVGNAVSLTTDVYPKEIFSGQISTVDPALDVATRNVMVEATINNIDHRLKPGMFANLVVTTGMAAKQLTLPQSAISYNSYGDLVYVLEKENKDVPEAWIAKQRFVEIGDTRGDQVSVLRGVKQGDMVVTSGQIKLQPDMRVKINNTIEPPNLAKPLLSNNHEG